MHRPTPRAPLAILAFLALAAVLAAGCGKKAEQAASPGANSDSMLASNPVEQPQGQIQPQTGVQPQGETTQPAPKTGTEGAAPAPAREPSRARHHTESSSGGGGRGSAPAPAAEAPSALVPAGTPIKVTIQTAISSETAHPGDSWTGTVTEAVTAGSAAPFPAGSVAHGVVDGVRPAARGTRAFLLLRLTSIDANGGSRDIDASADSLIAGSTTKRNVGAIAGGAAVGALLGKAIGGNGRSAVIGGILGGAAATGGVAASKGFQVEVDKTKPIVFHVNQDTRVRT